MMDVPRISLEILGALSGDLCCTVLASPTWTVWKLKSEIEALKRIPIQDQQLLSGTTLLQDHEVLSTVSCTLLKLVVKPQQSLHALVQEMTKMPGSTSCEPLLKELHDDPDALRAESAAKFYERLFVNTRRSHGYTTQARMMKLYGLLTASSTPSKNQIVTALHEVDEVNAIANLIEMHNHNLIELNRQRFKPLARRLRVELR